MRLLPRLRGCHGQAAHRHLGQGHQATSGALAGQGLQADRLPGGGESHHAALAGVGEPFELQHARAHDVDGIQWGVRRAQAIAHAQARVGTLGLPPGASLPRARRCRSPGCAGRSPHRPAGPAPAPKGSLGVRSGSSWAVLPFKVSAQRCRASSGGPQQHGEAWCSPGVRARLRATRSALAAPPSRAWPSGGWTRLWPPVRYRWPPAQRQPRSTRGVAPDARASTR